MPDANSWVTSSCAELGLVVTAPGELTHQRPWSFAVVHDVREMDGTEGRIWFKANGIGARYEPALISALSALAPTWSLRCWPSTPNADGP